MKQRKPQKGYCHFNLSLGLPSGGPFNKIQMRTIIELKNCYKNLLDDRKEYIERGMNNSGDTEYHNNEGWIEAIAWAMYNQYTEDKLDKKVVEALRRLEKSAYYENALKYVNGAICDAWITDDGYVNDEECFYVTLKVGSQDETYSSVTRYQHILYKKDLHFETERSYEDE